MSEKYTDEQYADVKSKWKECSNLELIELVENNIEYLPIVRDFLKDRKAILALRELNSKYPDIVLQREEDEMIQCGNPFEIEYFIVDNPWCNVKKMGEAYVLLAKDYIKNLTDEKYREELNEIYFGLFVIANVDKDNVKFYEDFIIENNDLSQIGLFLVNVIDADKDRLCKVICLSDNEEYKKIALQKYMIYAIKYLDLNKYNDRFNKFLDQVRKCIMKDSSLDLIHYIEQNKYSFINYQNFKNFILQEPDYDILNLLNIFNNYIDNPFVYQSEELDNLIQQWKKKYAIEKKLC